MNIEAILEALDAGLDIEQISMLERLIRGLRDDGITDEQEQYRAASLALRVIPEGHIEGGYCPLCDDTDGELR